MKKTVFFGLLAILLVFGFIGCDTGNGGKTTTYTVTFDSNGGSNVAAITGIISGSTIALPQNPTKENHDFGGWFTDNGTFLNTFTSSTEITSDLTVYAKWTLTQFIVIFDLDGGNIDGVTSSVQITVNYGETIENLPIPLKTYYSFGGWFTEKNGFGNEFTAITTITSNLTVFANWPSYNGPKSITITGLDSCNGKYGGVWLFSDSYLGIAMSKSNDNNLITSGTFTVDLWEDDPSIIDPLDFTTRWSGDGEYFVYIFIDNMSNPMPNNASRFLIIESTSEIMIQQKETITINISDYDWEVWLGSLFGE